MTLATLYRPQRGGLMESMAEVQSFDGTWSGLQALLPHGCSLVSVDPYIYDTRIGWDTFLVCASMDGVECGVGYTNGPLLKEV